MAQQDAKTKRPGEDDVVKMTETLVIAALLTGADLVDVAKVAAMAAYRTGFAMASGQFSGYMEDES